MDKRDLLPPGPGWELTSGESRLIDCAARGAIWQPSQLRHVVDPGAPEISERWPRVCDLRPAVIRCLLIGARWRRDMAPWPVHPRGVLIESARIEGVLDFEGCEMIAPLWLTKSTVRGAILLRDAKVPVLGFDGTWVRFDPDVVKDRNDKDEMCGYAVNAQRLRVDGGLYLRKGFRAEGGVCLHGANIRNLLDCSGGIFIKPNDGKVEKGALDARAISTGGNVVLGSDDDSETRFCATGKVDLTGAHIGGCLDCCGGRFANVGGTALDCATLTTGAGVILGLPEGRGRWHFEACGRVIFLRAEIAGDFYGYKASFAVPDRAALDLSAARIGAGLYLKEIEIFHGDLDLRHAEVASLHDDGSVRAGADTLPHKHNLLLDGFVYRRIHLAEPRGGATGWRVSLKWLQSQPKRYLKEDFKPQPWAQLITVLREMGYGDDAVQIAIAREDLPPPRPLSAVLSWPWRLLRFLYKWTVGYGYRPFRSLYWAAGLVLLGWLVFSCAYDGGYMVPHADAICVQKTVRHDCTRGHVTEFNSLVYALDVFLPIVDLHQDAAWDPSLTPYRIATDQSPPADRNASTAVWLENSHSVRLFQLGCHRFVYWLEETMGWIIASFLVAGLSGMMKKE
jgi:hypothetical protein